jgi:hypothetical protein
MGLERGKAAGRDPPADAQADKATIAATLAPSTPNLRIWMIIGSKSVSVTGSNWL